MKLLIHERKSCSKCSCYIEIRYYFVKDFVNKGKIKIKYYPTELMLADFLFLFCLFRDVILGYWPMFDIKYKSPDLLVTSPALKENIGITKFLKPNNLCFEIKALVNINNKEITTKNTKNKNTSISDSNRVKLLKANIKLQFGILQN